MGWVHIVGVVCRLVSKLERKAERVVVLGAYLPKLSKLLDLGNRGERLCGIEKSSLGRGAGSVGQREYDGVEYHWRSSCELAAGDSRHLVGRSETVQSSSTGT